MADALASVRRSLLVLAALVEDQLRRATSAFFAGDAAAARLAIAADRDVDAHELRVDDACVATLASAALDARDVRLLVAAMKTATALERIGDEAAGVASAALGSHAPASALMELARVARHLLSDAVEALLRGDVALARRVIRERGAAKVLGKRVARRLVDQPLADPASIGAALHAAEVARRFERIAAHAAGIAAMVAYAADGALEPERRAA
jgi:phosphate transport system protein